jgi:probable HAF family extracellular repeat protein
VKTAISGFLFVLLSSMLAAAQSYTVTDLGVLKSDNESSGFWINDSGTVVGCSDTETSEGYPCTGTVAGQHAFLWTKSGGMKDLGTLSGATISGAIGINSAGVMVGYSNVKGKPATNFVAVQWSASGAITNLGTLSGGSSSAAFEINSAGEIAGDSFMSSGIVDATSWTSSKIKSLGALPGAIFTAGLDINEAGHVVGESVFSYGPPLTSHAFVWNGSTMKDLGTLAGGTSSIANSININGGIAGQSNGSNTGGNWHAVRWDTGHVIHDLGLLSHGTYSIAFGINNLGTIVGYANTLTNAAHAILWTQSEGMEDLNALIPADSGWVLVNANAINNVGQITGYGTKNGKNHAFLLTPTN